MIFMVFAWSSTLPGASSPFKIESGAPRRARGADALTSSARQRWELWSGSEPSSVPIASYGLRSYTYRGCL